MEESNANGEAPNVDFSMQFGFAKTSERAEKTIFDTLCSLADQIAVSKLSPFGAIVVFGDFEKHGPVIDGMVQMKPRQNPIESFELVSHNHIILEKMSRPPNDGAIIVERTGQIIGAGVYLVVDDPLVHTPDDCGTRHKAAASFSKRKDVISVLTLSEETNTVRVWKDGKLVKTYRVSDEECKESQ